MTSPFRQSPIALSGTGALAVAASLFAGSPTPYILLDGSTFTKGCFPPCLCPIFQTSAFNGTFELEPANSIPLYEAYLISSVDFKTTWLDSTVSITGDGTLLFKALGGQEQRLTLDLKVGDEPTTTFDSDWVPVTTPFPAIDVTVSINGMYCFDTALHIVAVPLGQSADLDGDGKVDGHDLGILLGSWGGCPENGAPCPADLDGDGTVGPADLGLLLGSWD